jgi:hypothetical protein
VAALEERVAFLEMELLKQAIGTADTPMVLGDPSYAAAAWADVDAPGAAVSGAGWGAAAPPGARGSASGSPQGGAAAVMMGAQRLAAPQGAAGQLDPEVSAIAEALLIRRSLAVAAPPAPGAGAPWGARSHDRRQRAAAAAGGITRGQQPGVWRPAGPPGASPSAAAGYGGDDGGENDDLVPVEPRNGLAMAGTILAVGRA